MFNRLLQTCIIAAWAAFFVWLYFFDQPTLARLLHPRLWCLILGGSMVLVLFAAITLSRLRTPPAVRLRWTWPIYLVLLVPLLYFQPMQSARFDSQTFFDRSTAFALPETDEGTPAPSDPATSTPDEVAVETSFSRIVLDPQQYVGRRVDLLCQALIHEQLPENQFICYRFRITCCAADAVPIFVLVDQRPGIPLPVKDSWLRVRGPFSIRRINGNDLPHVAAEQINQEPEPAFPFIF